MKRSRCKGLFRHGGGVCGSSQPWLGGTSPIEISKFVDLDSEVSKIIGVFAHPTDVDNQNRVKLGSKVG